MLILKDLNDQKHKLFNERHKLNHVHVYYHHELIQIVILHCKEQNYVRVVIQ